MTRKTYLQRLKKNLAELSEGEISDAVAYYSSYFEDANDDEKVINELGTPENLAQMIIEKSKKRELEIKNGEVTADTSKTDGLYFEFKKADIKNLNLNISTAEVVIITGKTLSVETRGIEPDAISCNLSENGNLSIINQRRINIEFWKHNKKYRALPRILITFPDKLSLDLLKVHIGAGSLVGKSVTVAAEKGEFEVGAGNLVLNKIDVQEAKVKCGMGNLNFTGSVNTKVDIDCGMGNVSLNLKGNPDNFSYDIKVGLGDFRFNDDKKSGVAQVYCSEKKQTHLSVNCGMGSVNVKAGE